MSPTKIWTICHNKSDCQLFYLCILCNPCDNESVVIIINKLRRWKGGGDNGSGGGGRKCCGQLDGQMRFIYFDKEKEFPNSLIEAIASSQKFSGKKSQLNT